MSGTFRSPHGSPGLPPRLRVPPSPPFIHRKLQLSYDKQGLTLFPEEGDGLRLKWGAASVMEKADQRPERYVSIAGVLGVVKLWDSQHLLVVSPTESSFLFPSTQSKEVFTVRNVMAVRLDHAEAKALMDRLCNTSTGFKWPFRKSAEEDIPKTQTPTREELEVKIIAQIEREYESGGFMYAYDFDLSRSIQSKPSSLASLAQLLDHPAPPDNLPLWRRVDRRFWWNEHLVQPFIEGGHHAFVLPVFQGVAQATTFNIPIPSSPDEMSTAAVDFAVVSRRSRERAGLRYQRRGIDDDGHVANFCETEMIVRATVEGKESVFSFVQIRGSIPLRWSQKPWSTKPPPVLDAPVDQTYSVAALHFDELKRRYGKVAIVNLSEQTGKEGAVTNGYGELVKDMDDLTYTPFDFHAQCRGMKWEKISSLIEELDFDGLGYTWVLDGEVVKQQSGVFRTNCIDCLDRTNVVQSAIARHVLTTIFTQLGMLPDGLSKQFNGIWANNGDVLSVCYARTSALKGDFVRTGKRDLAGMLHDGISSINRIISGAFADFFAQAVINFMLGQRGLNVFSEFLENMTSMDAASLVKLSRVRAAAVETSSARVLEGEQRLAGWTLLSPESPNEKISAMEEKIVLLTPAALYIVSFNYSLDKVQGYTRVPLGSITKIEKGAYILSPLQEAGRDPTENAGFVVHFSRHQSRYSTYSMDNEEDIEEAREGNEYHAFKVLPREFSSALDDDLDSDAGPQETCRAVADRLVSRLREECVGVGASPEVVEGDVVSTAEAQASIGLLRKVEYFITRALWL